MLEIWILVKLYFALLGKSKNYSGYILYNFCHVETWEQVEEYRNWCHGRRFTNSIFLRNIFRASVTCQVPRWSFEYLHGLTFFSESMFTTNKIAFRTCDPFYNSISAHSLAHGWLPCRVEYRQIAKIRHSPA